MDAVDAGDAVITTDRLVVRPWRPEEAARLFDIRRRDDVAKWLSDPAPWTDVRVARDRIAGWVREFAVDPPCGMWAIAPVDAAEPAGTISLHRMPDDEEIEIGWYLHPDAAGRGLAREAGAGVLAHAFAHGVDRVWAIMWPHNTPSANVALAIGMRDLGIRDDPWYGTEEEPTSRMFRADRPPPDSGVHPSRPQRRAVRTRL